MGSISLEDGHDLAQPLHREAKAVPDLTPIKESIRNDRAHADRVMSRESTGEYLTLGGDNSQVFCGSSAPKDSREKREGTSHEPSAVTTAAPLNDSRAPSPLTEMEDGMCAYSTMIIAYM